MHHFIRVQLNGVFWKLTYIKLFYIKDIWKCILFWLICNDVIVFIGDVDLIIDVTWLQMTSISTTTYCKLLKVKRGFQVCTITLFDLKVGCPKLLVESISLFFHICIVMFNSLCICCIIRYMKNTNQDLKLFLSIN